MNTYSKALRHINMEDVKQKHRQKILEKKSQQEKERKLREELVYKCSHLYSNWREEISEGMTSDGMFQTTLNATGDATIVSGQDLSYGPDSPEPELYYGVGAGDSFDTRYVDTVVFTVSAGNGPLTVYMNGGNGTNISGGSGTYSIPIPPNLRGKSVNISWTTAIPYETTGYGNWRITNIRLQRRAPMNVFVPLDSPEATSFIRTGSGNLSPEEKQQRLKDMLKSSDEYVQKMLGSNFPGTGAVPPGESGTTPGVQITNIPTPKGIFTSQKSDAFMKGFNQGRAEQGLPPMDNMGRTISANNISTSTTNSYLQSRDQSIINAIKRDIEVRTKLQTTGDAQKYYSSPSMQRALDKLKSDLASREKDFANKYGGGKDNQQSSTQLTPEKLANIEASLKQLEIDKQRDKDEANRRNWELAANIGMDILTAAALLSPVPGDEAIAIGARTAAQTRSLARNFSRQNPGKYNPFLSDKSNALARKLEVGTNVKGQNPAFRQPIKNSYEPDGQLISEKRKLKSPQEVLNKLPGYYDGKPAPLGFPVEPPPEMVNGYHPDLVDGKKVADRFNRLDPESARAMPLTKNPHIDKKVEAARKKPK